MSIEITVLFDVVPDRTEQAADAFARLCAETREEEGALRFDAFRSAEHDHVIVLVEEWADQAAIDLHMKQEYVAAFLAATDGAFVRPPSVHRLRPLGA
ncbi:putative quinol monooxygenase [Streptomyces sp. NRRL S-340]|uniref:putative quinol monooxygenase n=1 Tax=Streptomyces sp. NRRL S-340 TaxID=1463901 RepID=UPI0005698CDC|nr:putative quinol monooxygenase [Streptomyces sp. NRRL S-340]